MLLLKNLLIMSRLWTIICVKKSDYFPCLYMLKYQMHHMILKIFQLDMQDIVLLSRYGEA